MKCLAIVLSFILVFIRLQVHSSLITPIENRHEHLLNSFKLSQLSSPERPKVFVFLCPPASFVHHQITVALELCRRGHHIVFASTPGFQKHLDNQLPLFQIDNPESSKIDVLEIGQAFDFNGRIKEMTQSTPNKRFSAHYQAMKMYESAFATITDSIDEIRRSIEIGDQEVKRKLELIFSEGSLVVIPGPWATPIQYCRLHGLPYIIMLPSPIFTLIFSAPLYVPKSLEGNDLGNNFGKKLSFRLKLLWNTIFPEGHSFDIKPLTEYPVLRLVQSLPSLTHLRDHSPLTVFTGPLVSKERCDPRHLSDDVLSLLESDNGYPVIYISMGSYAKLGTEQIEKLGNAFLPFEKQWGLIWALSSSQQASMSNVTRAEVERLKGLVVIENWIQSPAVLSHPNTKLFVSHCGANGLSEGVVTGTPILGLPLFGDQPINCVTAQENLQMVICRSLHETPTFELRRLGSTILLNNEHEIHGYAKRGRVLANKGYHGPETAADWIETASAVKGDFTFLATPPEREGITKSYCFDIIGAVVIITLAGCCTLSWCLGVWKGRRDRSILAKQKSNSQKKKL